MGQYNCTMRLGEKSDEIYDELDAALASAVRELQLPPPPAPERTPVRSRPVPSGRATQLTKQTGEYLVAAEICRRGMIATTFTGNVPHHDILATSENGRSVLVQVKAINGPSWQFDIQRFVSVTMDGSRQVLGPLVSPPCTDVVCVLILLAETGNDRFYVLPWAELQRIVVDQYSGWLAERGGVRPRRPDSFHCAVWPDQLTEHEAKWNIITEPTP